MKIRIYTLALLVSIIAWTVTYSSLFASETDDRIESSARQSYIFQTYFKDEDIKIHSQNGDVTLTGTASSDAYKSLARETVAGLPGVKGVDNQLAVKGEAVFRLFRCLACGQGQKYPFFSPECERREYRGICEKRDHHPGRRCRKPCPKRPDHRIRPGY